MIGFLMRVLTIFFSPLHLMFFLPAQKSKQIGWFGGLFCTYSVPKHRSISKLGESEKSPKVTWVQTQRLPLFFAPMPVMMTTGIGGDRASDLYFPLAPLCLDSLPTSQSFSMFPFFPLGTRKRTQRRGRRSSLQILP